ncbi:MAG: FAD-binding oxidoreductase [Proteobacteria bacterium]|nr:FAD-binding oxidoreductase [Pseudomonadota bacterium]
MEDYMRFTNFKQKLSKNISATRIIDDEMLCYAYGTDASVYRMIPQLVILVETQQEVATLLRLANVFDIKLTFRAAGTSLSGQAVTNKVLVVLSNKAWQNYEIINNGKQIRLAPGIIGSHANYLLKAYNTKIGPDPASINACKIGGIVANNSSGMCCGILNNTYHTLAGMKLLLADGGFLDSQDASSRQDFLQQYSHIAFEIKQIKQYICSDEQLVGLIKHKFRLKNTSGYSLNAFLDFDDPIDILTHLFVGSEGTLGFISEVTYNCVADNHFKQVSLIYVDSLDEVVKLTSELAKFSIDAMELLDISSLQSISHLKKAQAYLPTLTQNTAALLIEVSSLDKQSLQSKVNQLQHIIDKFSIYYQLPFTSDAFTMGAIWDLRKGIFPTIGANRVSGTSLVIEDIAVDIEKLPQAIDELKLLFTKFAYSNAAIFGHVLAGNIHFVFTPNLTDADEILRYKAFMEEMTQLIAVKLQGSLKAEHGCGRNMAPFVELEWGNKAYAIMWQIKQLLDPNNILNPEVILSKNPQIHLQYLKQMNSIDNIVDSCMECGFCESVCPSKNLTLTPRQRITTYRYIQKLKLEGSSLYAKFAKSFEYYGIQTCATTGLCFVSCPVNINTGELILKLKQKPASVLSSLWGRHFSKFIFLNRFGIKLVNQLAKVFGSKQIHSLSKKTHRIIPLVPVYLPSFADLPIDTHNSVIMSNRNKTEVLYIPSCSTRIFDDSKNNFTESLLSKMGYKVVYPANFKDLCCGQVFSSNGNIDLSISKVREMYAAIYGTTVTNYSGIIIDNSSCYASILKNNIVNSADTLQQQVPISDMVSFIANNLDSLDLQQKYNKLALHIDCSSKKIADDAQIMQILVKCSKEIVIPQNITCCGFAGTKGFTLPELNQAALYSLKEQISDCDIGVTFNRNCQIGLSFYGEKKYISLAELVYSCLL